MCAEYVTKMVPAVWLAKMPAEYLNEPASRHAVSDAAPTTQHRTIREVRGSAVAGPLLRSMGTFTGPLDMTAQRQHQIPPLGLTIGVRLLTEAQVAFDRKPTG